MICATHNRPFDWQADFCPDWESESDCEPTKENSMRITVIANKAAVVEGWAYPILWSGRILQPGEFLVELQIRDESAVRFTEGSGQNSDRLTIVKPGFVDVVSARQVVA